MSGAAMDSFISVSIASQHKDSYGPTRQWGTPSWTSRCGRLHKQLGWGRKPCWLSVMLLRKKRSNREASTFFKSYQKPLQRFWRRSQPTQIAIVLRERPCKLNPCPTVCCLNLLTKGQGKGTWALSQKTCQGFSQLCWQRLFGRPPFKQTRRNDKPCASTPKNSWTWSRTCQSTKHCLPQLLPMILYPAT